MAQNFESLVEILRMTEMKPSLQYFYMILFPYYVVLTFEPLAEILGETIHMNPLHAFYKTENFVNFSNFNFIDGLSKVAKCFSYSQIAIVVIF